MNRKNQLAPPPDTESKSVKCREMAEKYPRGSVVRFRRDMRADSKEVLMSLAGVVQAVDANGDLLVSPLDSTKKVVLEYESDGIERRSNCVPWGFFNGEMVMVVSAEETEKLVYRPECSADGTDVETYRKNLLLKDMLLPGTLCTALGRLGCCSFADILALFAENGYETCMEIWENWDYDGDFRIQGIGAKLSWTLRFAVLYFGSVRPNLNSVFPSFTMVPPTKLRNGFRMYRNDRE